MSPELAKAVHRLELKATGPAITSRQRGLLEALRDLGAVKVAQALEDILKNEGQAREDAMETVAFLRRAVK
jgi:hypothetical protein